MSLIPLSLLTKMAPPILGPKCGKCRLDKQCQSPKMKMSGEGRRKILICAEAPGAEEDRQGRQLVGKSGQLLNKLLLRCGVDMRADCHLYNALSCRPPNNEIKDGKMIEYCRPRVLDVIRDTDPNVIILLGKWAVKSVIGHMFKEDTKGIMRWAGFQIPNRNPNVWLCPTIHPAHVLRNKDKKGEYTDRGMSEKWLQRHLQAAVDVAESKPWKKIPDYLSRVRVVEDLHEAAAIIRRMVKAGKPVAVDYETTTLKPDGPHARIVCCAVSDGETTIAYPWLEPARTATGELLKSGVPLIASNMSFEDKWTWKEFGHAAAGFTKGWDTMLQAHTIDGRPGITSIKFQAYLHMGQEDYDSHLNQFLKSRRKGGNSMNQIKEIDRHDLLKYCGADALLEWMVAYEQMNILGVSI